MLVAAILAPQLVSQLRVVLGNEHGLRTVDSWQEMDEVVRRQAVDVAVVDPGADGSVRTAEIIEIRQRFPSLPVIVYTALTPSAMRAVLLLAPHGVETVVLHRFDDDVKRFRELLDRQGAHTLSDALFSRLTAARTHLTPSLDNALERLFRRPQQFFAVHDLAAAAGLTQRTIYRQFETAGLCAPRDVIVAARVLRAYSYLSDPGLTVEDVAAKLGYSAPRILARHMLESLGALPRTVRRRLSPERVVDALTRRLLSAAA